MSSPFQPLGRWARRVGCFWILGGGILGTLVLVVGLILLPWAYGPPAGAALTPVLTVIAYPTATPTPTITPTPAPTSTPAGTPTRPPAAGDLRLGGLVQIQGTQGDGLRIREGPGLDSRILFVALENEVFEIQEGPQEGDGYTWWYLVNPYDNSQEGWGVSNYLRTAEGN